MTRTGDYQLLLNADREEAAEVILALDMHSTSRTLMGSAIRVALIEITADLRAQLNAAIAEEEAERPPEIDDGDRRV